LHPDVGLIRSPRRKSETLIIVLVLSFLSLGWRIGIVFAPTVPLVRARGSRPVVR
jgi:hypothetical protein